MTIWIKKVTIKKYDNNRARYIERVSWDTVWLIIYFDWKQCNIENNPKLSGEQVSNRVKKFLSLIS